MSTNLLFCVVLVCQILLLSAYMPRKLLARAKANVERYPPAQYPRLYPYPAAHYQREQRRFVVASTVVGMVGVAIVIALLANLSRSGEWDHAIATGFGLLQYTPLVLWEFGKRRELRLMRDSEPRRSAELTPRRLSDYFPQSLAWLALAVFLALIPFVLYVKQFDFPWFGGWLNVAIIGAMNLGFVATIVYQVYGKKLDPYQRSEDRRRQIAGLARVMLLISIAATLFAMLTVTLRAFDLIQFKGISHSLYFQLLALMAFPVYSHSNVDYEVYKENHATT